ncbi:hypothetical protein CPB84DRAFT_733777 [Gymnopilus junonius]|uniref:Transmembrane protein n=1 Tax=Gymnopilus junonius TaxID=109634 RepID=A0A9P5NZU7_GYMJU|nr:hypothetical protein CPB84DRAFT_733777 [Gymnopilus junonius]
MYWHRWSLLFLWLATPLCVAGQSSNVTKCVASYEWSINSLHQTPCLVAAYLESLCGVPTSVDSIPNGTHYLGPTSSQQDPCRCSTVTYSVVSACGGCQGRTFQNWTTWSQFCDTVEISTFPQVIPEEVQVPNWAYINVTLIGNNFNPTVAQQGLFFVLPNIKIYLSTVVVLVSGSSALPTSTSAGSSSSTQSTSTSSSSATSSSVTSQTSSKSHSHAGAIAGGVVAGVVVLAAVCLFILWRFVRKKGNAVQKDFTFDSRALVSGHTTGGTLMTQTTGITSRFPESYNYGPSAMSFSQSHQHNPSDMSSLPLSPATTAVYTSPPPASRRSLESVTASMAQFGGYQTQPTPQSGYRGAAEV